MATEKRLNPETVQEWLYTGHSDRIRQHRKDILRLARTSGRPFSEGRVRLRTVAVSQFLAMLDKKGACTALAPFVVVQKGILALNDKKIAALSSRSRAHLLIQVANTMYRHLQFEDGFRLACKAERELEDVADSLDPLDYVIDWSEIAIWRARLAWRNKRARDVHDLLADVVHALEAAFVASNERGFGAITLHLAIALELWSAIDWLQGRITTARTKVFRSLALHADVKDAVRASYAHYTAGRIEYSHEESEFVWAEKLFASAEAKFKRLGHPFRWRATNLRARCAVRGGELGRATELVKNIDLTSIEDSLERSYVEGEKELTLAWIYEEQKDWDTSFRHAARLVDLADKLPIRIQAEGYLHRGMARSYIEKMPEKAHGDFAKARKLAINAGSRKIETACELACAELAILSQDAETARMLALRADMLMEEVESKFLRDWQVRVASLVDRQTPVPMNRKWRLAKEAYDRAYYIYHASASRSVQELLDRTGWHLNTYKRYRRKYGGYLGTAYGSAAKPRGKRR